MNLVYITRLSQNRWAGPNNSVPKQIEAQSKIDNVFWYNVNDFIIGHKAGNVKCHCINEYPSLKITNLPKPFNTPDLVVFESLYYKQFLHIALNCRKNNIPYIIIPRSSLTEAGQSSKALKKKIGNFLFFNKFIKNAIGIQYLTEKEYNDSGDKWNNNNIIIPNGIDSKEKVKKTFNTNNIKGIFVGRLDIYQKGLDLLIDACGKLKEELERKNCIIHIYGPERGDSKIKLENLIKIYQLEKIVYIKNPIFDEKKENELLDSDFFILTSRFEGHPMGLIEALSYGLPSLITTGTNMSEEVKNSDAGWISDVNVDSIVVAFRQLLNDIDKFQSKSLNAINLSRKYNWDDLALASQKKYTSLLRVISNENNETYIL